MLESELYTCHTVNGSKGKSVRANAFGGVAVKVIPCWIDMSHFKYLIVGGGNSAGYAARQFVKLGGLAGQLGIITEEKVVAYERPALSKAYLFPSNPARLPGFHTCVGGGGDRQDEDWYKQHGITYMTGSKVTDVDVKAKHVVTANGDTITFDYLIVATGARVRVLW